MAEGGMLQGRSAKGSIKDSSVEELEAKDNVLRLVLVGKTGVGKSATANMLCGADCFESKFSSAAVTQNCQSKQVTINDRHVLIIDTPGIFDAQSTIKITESEIYKCLDIGAPGIHAILFVMSLGRVTDQDINTFNTFIDFFGESMFDFSVMVFTHARHLKKNNMTIDNYIQNSPEILKQFLAKCSFRKIAVENMTTREKKAEQQRCHLIQIVESIYEVNRRRFNTEKKFREAETKLREKLKEEYEQKLEAAKAKYKEDLRKEIEAELEEEHERELEDVVLMTKRSLTENFRKKICILM